MCFCSQGVEGASAAAHALSLPAEAYGNDVSGHFYRFSVNSSRFQNLKWTCTDPRGNRTSGCSDAFRVTDSHQLNFCFVLLDHCDL